jgi:cytochrome c oxidase cbb3-type subunit 3
MSPPIHATTAEIMPIPDDASEDDAPILDHAYDGIREYDNPLPGWWKSIFIGSVMFAGFYALYFHVVGWGFTPDQKYSAALASYTSHKAMRAPGGPTVTEEMLAHGVNDTELLSHGTDVFNVKCIGCHAAGGKGQIGPNLTDSFQIHGTTRMDLYNTIYGGAPGTPMIAWSEQLPPGDILAAATYICSLRGTNVAGGKAAQGQAVGAFK